MSANPDADEAAAIAAALQRFIAETTAPVAGSGVAIGPWQRAALSEGVSAKATVQQHLEGGRKWLS